MKREQYHTFTKQVQENLEARSDVLGLIALGSMAGTERQPDEHSDHDFFVITEAGKQQDYRDTIDWLPDPERLVLHFQETDHGCKAIYEDGHILEYAIFDLAELNVARINSYRILFDRAQITALMPTLQIALPTTMDTQRVFDTMISNILVGAMRAARGETLSAHAFIKQYALRAFMLLCWQQLAADSPYQDSLDPFRRFEFQFPEIAGQLHHIMEHPIQQAAIDLLELSETRLTPTLSDKRSSALMTIRAYLNSLVR